ncbi:MAG: helix-turn-helix transcriptional regulator [Clostridiales bacterium]|nr:helix-turn-helix transcriptional regulator [Clostridiales bacterium]
MNLKQLRAIKRVSQKEVSSCLGCSPVVYSRYETGEREPSLEMLGKLADYFGVSTDCVLGRETIARIPMSEFEVQLIEAARYADTRAKEDALAMLKAHCVDAKKEGLA